MVWNSDLKRKKEKREEMSVIKKEKKESLLMMHENLFMKVLAISSIHILSFLGCLKMTLKISSLIT